jgi:hypothetical protein
MGGKPNAAVTTAGNRTLDAPSAESAGQRGLLFVTQDGPATAPWPSPPPTSSRRAGAARRPGRLGHYHVRGADDVLPRRLWTSGKNSVGAWEGVSAYGLSPQEARSCIARRRQSIRMRIKGLGEPATLG